MILTGKEIVKEVSQGKITISPFSEGMINPNSYNYRLGEDVCIATETKPHRFTLPADGYVLNPGVVLLGHTCEKIGSEEFVVSLIGRSSLGRMGLFLQIDADMSNLGKAHKWTLELTSVLPIKLYPRMVVGQVSFWKTTGVRTSYEGDYHDYNVPTLSYYDRE